MEIRLILRLLFFRMLLDKTNFQKTDGVIMKEWIDACTKKYLQCNEGFQNLKYGFLWWIPADEEEG